MKYFDQTETEEVIFRTNIVNDVLTHSVWSIEPISPATDTPTLGDPVESTTTTEVMLSGVTAGSRYLLKCEAHLGSGQIIDRFAKITGVPNR